MGAHPIMFLPSLSRRSWETDCSFAYDCWQVSDPPEHLGRKDVTVNGNGQL